MTQWFNVNDKLPPIDEHIPNESIGVLVCNQCFSGLVRHIAWYNFDDERWINNHCVIENVLYWMYLPDTPED